MTSKSIKEEYLTFQLASDLFEYRPEGVLVWKNPRSKTKKSGQVVGGRRRDGRQQVMLVFEGKNYLYLVYRIIWLLHHGAWPSKTIDHIDGDRTNDQIENLRDISQKGNNENRTMCLSTSSTGVLGVSYYKDTERYRANIGVSNKDGVRRQVCLGLFNTVEEASAAYLEAKEKYHKML